MKNLFLLLIVVFISTTTSGQVCIDGIYYNITSQSTVEVTHWNSSEYPDGIISQEYRYSGIVSIPSSVTIDGKSYSVTKLGDNSFMLSTVTKLSLPSTIVSYGNNCLESTHSLMVITAEENEYFFSEDNVIYRKLPRGKYEAFYLAQGGIGTIAFKEGTTRLGSLVNRRQVSKFIIPSSVSSLEIGQFSGCENLKEVEFSSGSSITEFPLRSFLGCNNLTRLINIPSTLSSISSESGLFAGQRYEKITMSDNKGSTFSSIGGCILYDKFSKSIVLRGNSSDDDVTIPSNLSDEIFEYVLSAMGNAKSITISEGYTSIDLGIFFYCSSLQTLNLPASVSEVSPSVDFPENATSINFSSLNMDYSSSDANGYLYSKDGKTLCFVLAFASGELFVAKDVTNIVIGAFDSVYDQLSYTVEPGNTAFSAQNGLLLSGDGTTLLAVPSSLSEISIPVSVTNADSEAFFSCFNLKRIYCPISTPPSVNDNSFWVISQSTLYVPQGSKTAYEDSAWGMSFSVVELETTPTSIKYVSSSRQRGSRLTYTDGKVIVSTPDNRTFSLSGQPIAK